MNHLILGLFVICVMYLLGMVIAFLLPFKLSEVRIVRFKRRLPIIILIGVIFMSSYLPHSISNYDQGDIQIIRIKDGNTGLTLEIKERDVISHIIENLNSVIFRKRGNSLFRMGYSFDMQLMTGKERVKKSVIVNSSSVIRYRGFFYHAVENELDYEYLQKLFMEAYPKN